VGAWASCMSERPREITASKVYSMRFNKFRQAGCFWQKGGFILPIRRRIHALSDSAHMATGGPLTRGRPHPLLRGVRKPERPA
jgi:hypothetical protein